MSPEQRENMKTIAEGYGVRPPRAGATQDRIYGKGGKREPEAPPETVYERLVGVFGEEGLENAERVVYVALSGLLVAFLGIGIAISTEAFFTATGREVPEGMDVIVRQLYDAFTPVALGFLGLSSLLGLYKQAQLGAGVTGYENIKDSDKR